MKVIGVDPGYHRLGVAIVERTGDGETLLYSTCITTDKTTSGPERLRVLGDAFRTLLTTHTPDALGIETLFFNTNRTTAMGVAEARGTIIYLAANAGCTIREFGPQEVKVAVTGYGKSDKRAVIDMVQRLVKNAPTRALDDEYDAIAVALTTLAHMRK